jgi:hypothetical protein
MYRDLRVADVVQMDVVIENGTVVAYRANMQLSHRRTA